jgi:putative ABC transport system permease protein
MASMLLIIIVAAALMNIGALTLYNYGTFIDEKAEQLNAPHLVAFIEKDAYSPGILDYLKSDLHVIYANAEDTLFMPSSSFLFGGGKQIQNVLIQNADVDRDIAPMSIIGETEGLGRDSIYAPFALASGGGYKLGDTVLLEYENQEYSFQIAGFVEDIMLGSTNMGIIGFYMPEPVYKRFMAESLATPVVMVSAKLTDKRYSEEVYNGFNLFCKEGAGIVYGFSITLAKEARSFIANITSMMLVAFALIITAAALIVIYFRISDTIRDDMKDIGILKAMGYTSGQIKASIMLQFLSITLAGSLLGILISYLFLPIVASMFASQSALIWEQGFAPGTSFACLLIMLLAVTLNVYGSLWRVKELHPVMAIREDIRARSVKRNFFRLDVTNLGLQFAMSFKLIMQNLKQNLIIALIIATVTFASAFGLMFYYNMAIDSDKFMGTIGGEMCSVVVSPVSNMSSERLREEISNMPEVRKAIFLDGDFVFIEGEEFISDITEDFDELEGFALYEGRYPQISNEAAIGGVPAEKLGKRIGDTIRVSFGNNEEEYIITGFTQSGNYMGKTVNITHDGFRRLAPDFTPNFIYRYLLEGERADAFIETLESRYGNAISRPVNMDELLEAATRSYVAICALMAVVVLIVTAVIVILILYFVIKTMIARRRRDFGVQKALGYTTFQLMEQIAISFLPVVSVGSVIGAIVGCAGINPMISAMFRAAGIMKFDMIVPLTWMGLLCAGIALMSYAVAILISYRIRKISAYVLITE